MREAPGAEMRDWVVDNGGRLLERRDLCVELEEHVNGLPWRGTTGLDWPRVADVRGLLQPDSLDGALEGSVIGAMEYAFARVDGGPFGVVAPTVALLRDAEVFLSVGPDYVCGARVDGSEVVLDVSALVELRFGGELVVAVTPADLSAPWARERLRADAEALVEALDRERTLPELDRMSLASDGDLVVVAGTIARWAAAGATGPIGPEPGEVITRWRLGHELQARVRELLSRSGRLGRPRPRRGQMSEPTAGGVRD